MTEVYYYVGAVRTKFEEWLGCATKHCKEHKKNKEVCHIRPETTIFPIGNGLYECIDCHHAIANSRQGDFWTVKDMTPYLDYDKEKAAMSKGEAAQLQSHLLALKEGMAKYNLSL